MRLDSSQQCVRNRIKKNSAVMISRDGKKIRLPKMDKNDLAVLLSHLMCA